MARSIVAAAFGIVVGMTLGAACGLRAEEVESLEAVAAEAGVNVQDLEGAVATVGLPARAYLERVGELQKPGVNPNTASQDWSSSNPALERRLDCLSWHESRHTPTARNPRSGAVGQFQFLWSTWAGTPQGRVGLSPFDPAAARAAARWMLLQGRAREFEPVLRGLC